MIHSFIAGEWSMCYALSARCYRGRGGGGGGGGGGEGLYWCEQHATPISLREVWTQVLPLLSLLYYLLLLFVSKAPLGEAHSSTRLLTSWPLLPLLPPRRR